MTDDNSLVSIEFKTTCNNSDEIEEKFLTRFEGTIQARDENDQKCLVGFCKASQLRFDEAMNHGYSCLDVFDIEGSFLDIGEPLLVGENEFSSVLYEKYAEQLFYISGVLIIERIEILPQYRGRDYGLLALEQVISQLAFDEDCIAALKAYPLQYEKESLIKSLSEERKKALGNFTCSFNDGLQKLVEYYRKAGFELFNSDSVMVRPLVF